METKKEAIKENVKLAKESGNKLTQNIDKEGNLIGINNTIEESLTTNSNKEVTSADIRKELFEGDNIVTKSKDNKFDAEKFLDDRKK